MHALSCAPSCPQSAVTQKRETLHSVKDATLNDPPARPLIFVVYSRWSPYRAAFLTVFVIAGCIYIGIGRLSTQRFCCQVSEQRA